MFNNNPKNLSFLLFPLNSGLSMNLQRSDNSFSVDPLTGAWTSFLMKSQGLGPGLSGKPVKCGGAEATHIIHQDALKT